MEILEVSSKSRKEALEKIKKGGIVIFPTDTVYGLLADAFNRKAVEKIFKVKKRAKNKSLPLFVKDIEMARKIAVINKKQECFLKKVWPGKTTVVLKRKADCGLPKMLFGAKKTIGLRIPDYRLIYNLLEKINRPLVATSANISGRPASTNIEKVLKQFKIASRPALCRLTEKGSRPFLPDLAVDKGDLPKSRVSKIIDLTKNKPIILRK